jgi:hypothetical protein
MYDIVDLIRYGWARENPTKAIRGIRARVSSGENVFMTVVVRECFFNWLTEKTQSASLTGEIKA